MQLKKILVLTMTVLLIPAALALYEFRPDYPTCSYDQTPEFGMWRESFDSSGQMYTCEYVNGEVYIAQNLWTNRFGEYFTSTNPDFWTNVTFEKASGNIRNVEIRFEYYAPSYNGVCTQTNINSVTGFYNSPQFVLLTNAESDFTEEGTFDDAFYQWNDEIVCDQWGVFSHKVSEFENDWGSSFSGQSKTIGNIGFESKNMYLRNIRVIGDETAVVW